MEDNGDIRFKEVCYWDKRKKCDSLYIEENRKLKKKLHKVLAIIENCSDGETKKEVKKILEKI
jgi:hypothetical protein